MTALSDLVVLGEGSAVEFKRSLRSDLGREICAFANATGGVILLGVEDDGTVCGVRGHNRLRSQVQSIARLADPPISVELESMGDVLAVRVPAQRTKPYSFGGKFFMREEASSQQMSRDEIREFFFAEGAIRFDESPSRRFSLDRDLDDETWAVFRRRAKIPGHMDPRTALRNLELLAADGRMTNAGAWLLAKRIRRFRSSAHLSCALFEGTTKREILDRRDFQSDVYSMVDDAMIWVRSRINGLPAGMTEAELGVKSVPRNPLLFGILHRMDAVEHIGSGVRRIRDLCREWGCRHRCSTCRNTGLR